MTKEQFEYFIESCDFFTVNDSDYCNATNYKTTQAFSIYDVERLDPYIIPISGIEDAVVEGSTVKFPDGTIVQFFSLTPLSVGK